MSGLIKHFQKRQRSKALIDSNTTIGCRSQRGIGMIELLIAVSITMIFSLSLLGAICGLFTVNTQSRNQLIAEAIAQEILDDTRNQNWATINGLAGTTLTYLINRTTSSQTGPTMIPRPLVLDMSNNSYSAYDQSSLFRGTATESFTTQSTGTILVAITVSWTAERNSGKKENLVLKSLITQYGLHN